MNKKKQHIIPHCYQKAWIDPETPENKEPYIWLFDKNGNLIKNKSPKKTFTETDFYTIPNELTGRDLSLEDGLSTIEYQYEKVYREVISLNHEINEDNKLILCAFIAAMNARTWAYKQFIGNQFQEMLEIGKQAEKHLKKLDKKPEQYAVTLPPPKGSKTISMSEIQELAERPLQSLMFPKIAADIGFLITMNLAILTNETEDSFVSSDDPCCRFSN